MTEKTSIVIDGNIDPLRAALREAAREMGRMADSVKDASRTINNETREMDNGFRRIPSSIGDVTQSLSSLRNVVAGGVLVGFAVDVFKTNMAMESLQSTLKYTTGSTQAADKEFAYIRETAKALGLELETAARAYIKLSASAQGTSLAGEETRKLFEALAGASVVMGLSAFELEGALLAVSQMMSKGKVNAEELRGQLGERLPGAFNIAADAMGVTTAELDKMLKTGEVLAEDFLPKLRAELERRFEPALENALKSTRTQVNLLSTAWTNLKLALGDPMGVNAALGHLARLVEGLARTTSAFKALPRIWAGMAGFGLAPSTGRTATGKITGLPQQAGVYDNALSKDDTAFLNGLKTAKERQAEQRRQLYSLLTQDKITIDEYNKRLSEIGARSGGGGGGRSARQKAPPKEKDNNAFRIDNMQMLQRQAEKEIEILNKTAQQALQIKLLQADGVRNAERARIDELAANSQFEVDLGKITQAQHLANLAGFNQQRLVADQLYIDQKKTLALEDPEQNPVELERIELEKATIRQRYAQQGMDVQRQQVLESQTIWRSLTDSISGLWDKGMQALMNGTLTWRNAFRAIGAELVSWFAVDVVGKKVKAWLAGEQMQTIATKTGTGLRELWEKIAGIKTIATKGAETTAVAGMNAVQAGTGAAASQASIPFVGPVLALAAMAAVFAAVSGLGKKKSAMGGYDIPRGLNPLTQLHEEEMVLPKNLANVVRGMAAPNNSAPAESSQPMNFYIQAMDGYDVERVLMNNGPALEKAFRARMRDFGRA